MKPLITSILALLCALSLTATCFAANPAQGGGQRRYRYATAARDARNFAGFSLSGGGVQIHRRGYQQPHQPDRAEIRRTGAVILHQSLEWEEEPVDGDYYGYTARLDIQGLEDGEYTLSLESSAIQWVGESNRLRTNYTLASVGFAIQGGDAYFPADNRISSRYNSSLLQQLQQGYAPDDFAALKEYYAKQENSRILSDIEDKAKELTAGAPSDLEKCLAIEQWITRNIAYDFALPRENIGRWLEAHPQDSPRLDDPLHAFDRGYALCYGYAKLTTLMLGYAGVECVYIRGRLEGDVSGTLDPAEISSRYSSAWNAGVPASWSYRAADGTEMQDVWNHAWNAVNISGSWYFLDTCADAVYGHYPPGGEGGGSPYLRISQCYSGTNVFPSLGQISNTHMAVRYGADGYGIRLKDG